MKEAEHLHELLNHWIKYSRSYPTTSTHDFAKWLLNQTESRIEESGQAQTLMGKQMQLGILLGRLSNFADLWGKLAFKDIPIRSFEEYGILKEVEYKQSPSKNELANVLVNEKSTAFEIIKRLIRDGLFSESIDKNDKRIRRVTLTQKGKKVIEKADHQAQKVAQLLVGNSTEQDIDDLIKKFSYLNDFHTGKYESEGWKSIDDLLN
ncbi:MAG: MarR family winged helix-turn-helix transcriptional regulator [Bacteroidota bacterium]